IPPGKLAAPFVSMVFTEPPPPEPSMTRMIGRRKSCAISSAISGFAEMEASAEPPRTVKSSPTTTTVRPSTLARPNTQFAGVSCFSSPCASYSPMPAMVPSSWKLFWSVSLSMRSRTVSRPWSRCRLTFSTPPISRANASRRARSSSSGFHTIRFPCHHLIVVVRRHRDRFSLQPVGKDIAVAVEQRSDGSRKVQHVRRRFLVHPLLVIHRRQQPDRHHDVGLVLRRPQRHGATIDMRAPGAESSDVAMLAQMTAAALDARARELRRVRCLALHFIDQGVGHFRVKCSEIGAACRRACHADAAAGAFMQAERIGCAREFEIDEMKSVGDDEADGARQMLSDVLQAQPDQ